MPEEVRTMPLRRAPVNREQSHEVQLCVIPIILKVFLLKNMHAPHCFSLQTYDPDEMKIDSNGQVLWNIKFILYDCARNSHTKFVLSLFCGILSLFLYGCARWLCPTDTLHPSRNLNI